MFFVVFDHANACANMRLLVEIQNIRLGWMRAVDLDTKFARYCGSFETDAMLYHRTRDIPFF